MRLAVLSDYANTKSFNYPKNKSTMQINFELRQSLVYLFFFFLQYKIHGKLSILTRMKLKTKKKNELYYIAKRNWWCGSTCFCFYGVRVTANKWNIHEIESVYSGEWKIGVNFYFDVEKYIAKIHVSGYTI